jgi:hypothetical protein
MNLPYRGVGGARVREDDEGWAGMANDIDFDTAAPATVTTDAVASQTFIQAKDSQVYVSPCKRCGGSGRYNHPSSHGRQCFLCHGTGKQAFKTSPEQRAKARQRSEDKREQERLERVRAAQAWGEQHPDVIAWINTNDGRFDFATAMSNALGQYSKLTEGQTAAVRRCIERDKARELERAAVVQAAPTIQTERLFAAFEKAKASGLKWPKLHFDGYVISMAGPNSANAGALYVKSDNDVYLGKIFQGKFLNSRDCTAEVRAQVIELMADPEAASKAYGLRTGSCCICNRELTDPVSVANGIGPICANRFF